MGSPEAKQNPCHSADFRGDTTAVVSVEDIVDLSALEAVAGNFDLCLKCEDGVVVRAHRAVITPQFSSILKAIRETLGSKISSDEIVCVVGDSRTWELIKHRLNEPYMRGLLPPDAAGQHSQQRQQQ